MKNNNKKNKNKITGFILQSLSIFAVWLIGEVLIFFLRFENSSAVSIGWTVIVVLGTAIFRMVMSEKKDDE